MASELDFGLGTELPPLDLGESLGPTFTPPSAPNTRQQAKSMAPLLALLPIALAKGGRVGAAALLQGFQRAREQAQVTERQTMLDERQAAQMEATDAYRRQQLNQQRLNNEAIRRQQFLQTAQGGLEKLDTPEAVRAYLALMSPQAQSVGVRPESFEGFVMEQMTPTRLQKKEATRILEEATKQYKDSAPQHVYTLSDGTQADWAELNRRAGVTVSQTPVPTNELAKSSLEVQAADALARGDTETYNRLLKVKDQFGDAGRAPADPVLAQIRDLQLQTLRAQQQSGAMTPAQAAMSRGLADDYTRDSKDYLTRLQAYEAIRSAATDPSAAGDLALIFSFMKMLDPGSTVREGEFANAQNAAGVSDQIRNWYNRIVSGERLNPTQRGDFAKQAQTQFVQAQRRQRGLIKVYTDRATRARLNPQDVLIDYDSVFGVDTSPINVGGASAQTAPATGNPYRGGATAAKAK